MNVLMIAPGYPGEMPYFCRGLTQHGGKVYGLSDVPEGTCRHWRATTSPGTCACRT